MDAFCRTCGAEIDWIPHLKTGKLAPIDVEPVRGGNIEVVANTNGERCYIVVAGIEAKPVKRRTPHFATCPDAAKWRR